MSIQSKPDDTGLTLYCTLIDAAQRFIVASTGVAEEYTAADWAKYVHVATELTPGNYVAEITDSLPAGDYRIEWRYQSGNNKATTDAVRSHDVQHWDGTNWPPANVATATAVAAIPTAAQNGKAAAVAILSTPDNKLATNERGEVTAGTNNDKAGYSLAGSSAAAGPSAVRSNAPICYKVAVGATLGLYAKVSDWDGRDLAAANVSAISYTIYDEDRQAIVGHSNVSLTIADVLSGVKSDGWASDYNLRIIPSIAANQAFARLGKFVVEVSITTLTSGQPILVVFHVAAR